MNQSIPKLFVHISVSGVLLAASSAQAFFNKLPIFNRCYYSSQMTSSLPDKKVVLTFDDGPNKQTARLLEILDRQNVKATFFVMGSRAQNNTQILKDTWMRGHIIANHSYTHRNFHDLYQGGVTEEIMKTDKVLSPFMKEKFFRYPFGNSTCAAEDVLNKNDYIKVGWQVDTCDYAFSNGTISDSEAKACGIASHNRNNLLNHSLSLIEKKQGGIVLFHDIHATTVDMIEPLIIELKNRGYQFVNLDDSDVMDVLKRASNAVAAKTQAPLDSQDYN